MAILRRYHKLGTAGSHPAKRPARYWGELRRELFDAAWEELQDVRKYLTLRHVVWRSLRYRDERTILKPYWRRRHRQPFHDGVCVALLIVAVREALHTGEPSPRQLPHARMLDRITTTIAGDNAAIARYVDFSPPSGPVASQAIKLLGPLGRLRSRRDRSWQAAYNLACTYAAIAQDKRYPGERHERIEQVVTSLRWAVEDPRCEIERPSEWIPHDPDFQSLSGDGTFGMFLRDQERCDYPDSPGRHPAHCRVGGPAATHREMERSGRPG